MTVFILIEEHQNDHGYVDTAIAGVFQHQRAARDQEAAARRRARAEGLLVEDEDSPDGGWQVSWKVEEYAVT
jgi:hypothetical protein